MQAPQLKEVTIYSRGLVCCSVCVPKDMTISDIEYHVNMINPTGIDSQWKISEDKTFADKEKQNPCECETAKDRLHYLLNC